MSGAYDLERCPLDPDSEDILGGGRPGVRVPVGAYVVCLAERRSGYVRGGTSRYCIFEDGSGQERIGPWSDVFVQSVGLALPVGPAAG